MLWLYGNPEQDEHLVCDRQLFAQLKQLIRELGGLGTLYDPAHDYRPDGVEIRRTERENYWRVTLVGFSLNKRGTKHYRRTFSFRWDTDRGVLECPVPWHDINHRSRQMERNIRLNLRAEQDDQFAVAVGDISADPELNRLLREEAMIDFAAYAEWRPMRARELAAQLGIDFDAEVAALARIR